MADPTNPLQPSPSPISSISIEDAQSGPPNALASLTTTAPSQELVAQSSLYAGPVSPYNASQAPAAPAQSEMEVKLREKASLYPDQFKAAIICALGIEFVAVSRLFECATQYTNDGDPNIYTIGIFAGRLTVLLWPGRVGELHAGLSTQRLLSKFTRIELALLVGICGAMPRYGGKNAIYLGDVIIGTQVWRYGHNTRNIQRPDGGIDMQVRNRLQRAASERVEQLGNRLRNSVDTKREIIDYSSRYLSYLQESSVLLRARYGEEGEPNFEYPGAEQDRLFKDEYLHRHRSSTLACNCASTICHTATGMGCRELLCEDTGVDRVRSATQKPPLFNIHVGTIASADSVLRGRQVFDQAFRDYSILGIEMEGGGVSEVAASCMIIKSAADYADTHKNKDFQGYAAATAASVARAILERLVPTDGDVLRVLKQPGKTQVALENHGLQEKPQAFQLPLSLPGVCEVHRFVAREEELSHLHGILSTNTGRRTAVVHGPARHKARHEDYKIAWICALPLELAASRAMLDEEHCSLPTDAGDDNTYVLGHIYPHNIVMACLPGQYGTNNAAIVTTNLKRSFPSILATLMVGISGGSPSQADLYLGDVVVGTRVMQYDMGKVIVDRQFQETAHAMTPAPLLNSAVSNLRSRHGPHRSSSRMTSLVRSRLPSHARPSQPDRLFQSTYEHPPDATSCDECDPKRLQPRRQRLSDKPGIHYGVIASSNRVIRNGKERDDIARRHLALCFEMEAAGMMDNLRCLPIRGICDYSDSHKNKEWQDYAAATAAAYARELLEVLPPSRELGRTTTFLANARLGSPTDDKASKRRQRLLKSLDFPRIDARKTDIEPAYAKTCCWLLSHSAYLDWLKPEMQLQNHGFLWMRGKAGSGKSTMMKFAYLETKRKYRDPSTAVASFFFNARGYYLEKSITGMYRSLLMQLFKSFLDLQSGLDDMDIIPENQEGCPDLNALKELLRSAVLALGRRSFTCFIDALDECDEQEVQDMVQFFEDLAEDTTNEGIQFRICFSSRPYPYIDIRQGILLTLEDESGHADDLVQYVKNHLKIKNHSLLADLQSQILDKAAGVFMWIVLVVRILNKESGSGALAIRMKLSEIPPKLSDLFRSMLTRDQDRVEWLQLCILWILCADRPLNPAEFRHALWAGLLEQKDQVDPELPDATNMDDCVKLVTSSSKGLAEITKSKLPTVRFIHESVRDFLVKEKGLQVLWPDLGFEWEGPSHERLKRCCITYLHHPSVRAVLTDLEGGDDDRNAAAENCPFLEYASQRVLHHADAAGLVVPQDDFLSQFFASGGIRGVNLFKRFKSQRYGSDATPLYVLADSGFGNLIRIQTKRELTAYVPGERYEYPLFAALANGYQDAVAALLDLPSTTHDGVDITEGLKYGDFTDYKGRTPLSWAAQEGRLAIVRILIHGGANLDEADRGRHTPLLRAIKSGHKAVARFLIDKGADVHAKNWSGSTALILASENGQEAVARLLIDKGADIHADGWTALVWASGNGHEAVARLLIDKGVDVHASGSTALILAARNGHEAVARLLIDKGADVHAKDSNRRTALILALENGHEAVARLLRGVQRGEGNRLD